jgi:hypothetical protein
MISVLWGQLPARMSNVELPTESALVRDDEFSGLFSGKESGSFGILLHREPYLSSATATT